LNGSSDRDILIGDNVFAGNNTGSHDVIWGSGGADEMTGGAGNDIFRIESGDFVAGEYIDGSLGDDELLFVNAGNVDLRLGSLNYIEKYRFESGISAFTINYTVFYQPDFGGNPITPTITGSAGVDTINIMLNNGNAVYNFPLTFINWSAEDRIVIQLMAPGSTVNATSQNDTIIGTAGIDIMNGGLGADSLDGGDGNDTASYANATSTVQVVMYNTAYNTGEATGDTFTSIENLQGSSNIDILVGGFGSNTIFGGDGDDWIDGSYGADFLYGEGGSDNIASRAQADLIDGGADFDLVRYDFADAGLHAYLYDPSQNSGFAAGDTLTSIEGMTGSYFSDDLRGGVGVNVIYGLGGDDFIIGLGSGDLLIGGDGYDLFHYVTVFLTSFPESIVSV
jgi:Ca2+-binding RTX toxin-like protein